MTMVLGFPAVMSKVGVHFLDQKSLFGPILSYSR